MIEPSELTNTLSDDALAEIHEKAFQRIFGRLDTLAITLAGSDWTSNKVFEVNTSRRLKLPTSRYGILDADDYRVDTVEFTATKADSDDDDDSFLSVFILTQNSSYSVDIEEVDSQYHEQLIDFFFENFPETMHDCLHTMQADQDTDVMTEDGDGDLDLDTIDPEVLLDACGKALTEIGTCLQLGRTVMYTVSEGGNFIEYSEQTSYDVGFGSLKLAGYDSTTKYGVRIPVHGHKLDKLAAEHTITPLANSIVPAREKISDPDTGEHILMDAAFHETVENVFGDEDHAGIPYMDHIQAIENMLNKLAPLR